ncbi:MAG: Uma2 family endonuclease [Verrucomicrobia bacterium]|nr:MAG: Uma2 family endonuclease [Verrucomicrobiota bacterium]
MKAVAMEPLTVEDYRLPAPNRYHQDISLNITLLVGKYLEKHPIGKLYTAPFDVYFDEINVHQPDLVFVSKKNQSILTYAGAEGAPDFIVEILSPKTAGLDKKSKRRVFARCGVKELWLIDPEPKLVHVYFLQKDAERPAAIYREQDTFTSPHFPGLKIKGVTIFKK